MQVIYNFLLFLDGVVYSLVDYVYDIFDFLAKLNIFDSEQYGEITGKIYIILGLIMMFVLSYSLLRAVMNPDDFAKGEKSFPNLIKNIIISLALIVVMPAIFEFATDFQMAILDNNTIPKFILGDSAEVDYEGTATADESVTNDAGRMMSYYVFRSFFYPNPDWCSEKNHGYASAYGTGDDGSCTEKIKGNGWWGLTNGDAFYEVDQNVLNGEASFFAYSDYGESTADGRLTYYMLITTIAGGFLVYVLASFCFDMAIRVIKLAFYELIAPIPIICRILPGGNMKDVFSKWVKQIISVYIEVFIRVAIMYLGVYLIKIVVDAIGTTSLAVNGLSWHKQAIVVGLLIIGVIIFIKQAPKLIGDMFHLDTGGMKLGIMDKLAMGGGLAAGAFLGGGVTAGTRNVVSGIKRTALNTKNATGVLGKGKAVVGGIAGTAASFAAGTVSGAVRGGKAGLKSKNIKDAASAAGAGAAAAVTAAGVRDAKAERYKANGKNAVTGRVADFIDTSKEWAGVYNVDRFKADNKVIDEISSRKKAVRTSVEGVIDGEANKANSSFSYGGFSASELRQKLLDIQNAKTGTLKDSQGNTVSVSKAQQIYDEYRNNFSQALQNVALSQSTYDSIKDEGIRAKLAEANSEAQALKVTLSRNLDKDYVKMSGFNQENVNGDLSVTEGPLKSIGDKLDIQKAKNNAEIARLERQKAEKENEKKK